MEHLNQLNKFSLTLIILWTLSTKVVSVRQKVHVPYTFAFYEFVTNGNNFLMLSCSFFHLSCHLKRCYTVYYKLRQVLQSAMNLLYITNRDRYYKVRWLLQIATVHLSSRGWQVARQSVAQPFYHAKQLVMLRLSSSHPIGNNFPCHYLHFLYYYYYCCCCCCCCLWWNLFLGLLVLRLSISSLLQSATEQTLAWKDLLCFVKTLWYWNI